MSRRRSADIDRGSDLHTHSTLTDGADDPEAMADAAVAAGLHTWGLSDHVRIDSSWVVDYVPMVRSISRPGLAVRCGVEAKILDASGRLDLPADLPPLDHVLIADHQFPGPDGPLSPREMAGALGAGVWSVTGIVDTLVEATCAAVRRCPAPAVVVHPFSLLPKLGCGEEDVTDEHLGALAAACLAWDGAVEINEKWRCPSARVIAFLLDVGVRVTSGSDAHRGADVGARGYLDAVLTDLESSAGPVRGPVS